jgi:hypothetical protein
MTSMEAGQRVGLHPQTVLKWQQRWAKEISVWTIALVQGDRPFFPTLDTAHVTALACERPQEKGCR